MLKCYLLVFLSLFQQTSFAFTLQESVQGSMRNNKQLAVAKKNLETEVLATSEVTTEFLPNIHLDFRRDKNSYTNPDDINSYSNSSFGYYRNNLRFSIEQDLFTGLSTINKLSASNAQVKQAYENYYLVLNEVIFNTISSYQSLMAYRKVLKINNKNIEMAIKSVDSIKKSVKNAADTVSTLYLAEAELSRVRSEKASFMMKLLEAEKGFKYLTGIEAPEKITTIELGLYDKFTNFDEFIALVYQNNHQIKSKYHAYKTKENIVKTNISNLSPIVRVHYSSSRTSRGNHNSSSNDYPDYNTMGLNVIVPIFYKGGMHYVAISKAKRVYQASKFDFENSKARVNYEAQSIWGKYKSTRSILKESIKAEQQYYKSYEAFSKEYKLGAQTIINVINSQRDYNRSAIQSIQNEMEYKTNLFSLYKLIGNLPEIMTVE